MLANFRSNVNRVRNRGVKLSFIVSVLVGVSIIFALIISVWSVYQVEQASFTERTLELNRINSERLAATVNSLFQSMNQSLALTAAEVGKHFSDSEDTQYHLDLLKTSSNNFNSTLFIDAEGIVTATAPSGIVKTGVKSNSPEVLKALELKGSYISEPYITANTKKLVVLVSQPAFGADGKFIGIVAGSIYLQEDNIFKDILDKVGQDLEASYTYAVSKSGIMIFHPDPERIGRKFLENSIIQAIMNGQPDAERVLVNSDGISMLASEALVDLSGWGVVTQTPTEDVLSLTKKVIKRIILSTIPFIILLFLLAWWVATKVAKPLTQLAQFAGVFADAERRKVEFPQIKHWNYEANELNRAIIKAVRVLQDKVEHYTLESQTDALTGLMNRRSIDSYLELWMQQEVPFFILLLDLDHFKKVNDNYGHLMGDEMLKFLARIMLNEVRAEDICCRFGGEEFVILLPRVQSDVASKIAERIRMRMEFSENPIGSLVTLSLGIAEFPANADTPAVLFERVDRALYRAKQNGRNQIVVYKEDME